MSKIKLEVIQQFEGQAGTLVIGNQAVFGSLVWAIDQLEDKGLKYDQDIINAIASNIEHFYFSRDMELNYIEQELGYKIANLDEDSYLDEFNELAAAIKELNTKDD